MSDAVIDNLGQDNIKNADINSVGRKERIAFYFAALFRDMSYGIVGGFLILFYIDIMGFGGTAALLLSL